MKFTILSFLVTLKKRYFEILSKNNTLYEIFVLNVRRKKRDKKRNTELRKVLQSLMQQEPFPLPTAIEIETLNRCNGDCGHCDDATCENNPLYKLKTRKELTIEKSSKKEKEL